MLLSDFQGRIAADRKENAGRFLRFQSRISTEIRNRKWYVPGSGGKVLGWSIPGFIVIGIVLLVVGGVGLNSEAPAWGDVLLIVFGVCCFPNAFVLLVAAFNVRLWRKRSRLAQAEAERWTAFRRYLTDFPRLEDAPPTTLALWEGYLVYGIAFGIAARVLAAAHLHMPPGAARPELDLLDQRQRQSRLGSQRPRHREARRRLRLGAHTAGLVHVLIELQLQLELRFWRKLLRRRRRR